MAKDDSIKTVAPLLLRTKQIVQNEISQEGVTKLKQWNWNQTRSEPGYEWTKFSIQVEDCIKKVNKAGKKTNKVSQIVISVLGNLEKLKIIA